VSGCNFSKFVQELLDQLLSIGRVGRLTIAFWVTAGIRE
jgi:hypothetical protein